MNNVITNAEKLKLYKTIKKLGITIKKYDITPETITQLINNEDSLDDQIKNLSYVVRKEYYNDHKDSILKSRMKYAEKNKDKIVEYRKKWAENNKEYQKEYMEKYYNEVLKKKRIKENKGNKNDKS
jgi:hypothetical protein